MPDFLLEFPQKRNGTFKHTQMWIEIKPTAPTPTEIQKCALLARQTQQDVMIFYGGKPSSSIGMLFKPSGMIYGFMNVMSLSEFQPKMTTAKLAQGFGLADAYRF
jgi:hypothetical protein